VVLLLGLATLLRSPLQDRLYLNQIQGELRRLETRVTYVQKLDNHQRRAVDRLLLLQNLKGETALKAQALAELTRILPPTVWLQEVDLRDGAVVLQGFAESASPLLTTLGASPHFHNAEFLSSITKSADGKDMFRIRARIAPLAGGKS
jgi:Tfp pilus assembly protein PilN